MINAGEFASPMLIQRFHREAEAAANLHHPHIVPIYEIGALTGQHFFSMQLIEGAGLDRHISRSGFNLGTPVKDARAALRNRQEEIASILSKVARAVDYAHQHGVLHRDLKPGNIILDSEGEPHLTDFGVAKVQSHDASNLTASGAVMGTPSYMAPEQAAGDSKRITVAADVYSLGAILYVMLTGSPPFRADTPVETLRQVIEQEPKHPSTLREGIDSDLATIAMKCLEKEPRSRYSSAAALAEDLERWTRKEPIQARPAGPIMRLHRWTQRNPAPTALMLSLFIGLASCLGLLHVALKARSAAETERNAAEKSRLQAERAKREKEQKLEVIKVGLDNRLNELWLDRNRGASELISAAELDAYAGLDWLNLPGPTNRITFGVYVYTKPGRMLRTFAPILLTLGNELASSLDERVEIDFLIFRSYESAFAAFEEGRIDFGRMGPSSYVQLKARDPRIELLASQIHTEPLTLAIFTRMDSSIEDLPDLRGKSFAFGDKFSTTGRYVPMWVLFQAGLRLADLTNHVHLQSQAEVIAAVSTNAFDAGAANLDLVRRDPNLKVIATFPLKDLGLCWVAGPSVEARLTRRLRERMLATSDPTVFTNLESKVVGFQLLDDSLFNPLRGMMRQGDAFLEPR
jgi:ABC-type phosphate/phosphonate transport system substrate-binding protein